MGVFPLIRRLHLPALVLFLASWALGPVVGVVQQGWHAHAHAETPVSAAAIEVPDAPRVICHHHPEGCPKDCFCPKIVVDGSEAPASEAMVLREPALVRCTVDAALQLPPMLMAAWTVFHPEMPVLLDSGERLLLPSPSHPHDPFLDPPSHVPLS